MIRCLSTLLLSTAMLTIIACSSKKNAESEPEKVTTANYFPSAVGMKWEYETKGDKSPGTITDEIVEVRQPKKTGDRIVCKQRNTTSKGSKINEFSIDDKGVYAQFHENEPGEEPIIVLRFPVTIGDKWTQTFKHNKIEIKSDTEIKAVEDVVVSAGKFRAIPVRQTISGPVNSLEQITYFANGIGMVKLVATSKGKSYSLELVKYTNPSAAP